MLHLTGLLTLTVILSWPSPNSHHIMSYRRILHCIISKTAYRIIWYRITSYRMSIVLNEDRLSAYLIEKISFARTRWSPSEALCRWKRRGGSASPPRPRRFRSYDAWSLHHTNEEKKKKQERKVNENEPKSNEFERRRGEDEDEGKSLRSFYQEHYLSVCLCVYQSVWLTVE